MSTLLPDVIPWPLALPLAGAAWGAFLLPYLRAWRRDRRARSFTRDGLR